ncbi:cytochrome P450 [Streptomyces sp. NBC_01092]|uniref:cytochrome P450 n=1 Tax=Streptomyces sp. NBC_01092 TaxID=2903748 RepID=UPI003863FB34|nr:cytochrome P450 [Streptomyces sp. NBC_01092]
MLGGTQFPANSQFLGSIPALHLDAGMFSEPHRFDPDRWVRKPVRDLPRGAYLPFGAGNRMCIANNLAWTENDDLRGHHVGALGLKQRPRMPRSSACTGSPCTTRRFP